MDIRGREIVVLSVAFVAGDFVGGAVAAPAWIYLCLALDLWMLRLVRKWRWCVAATMLLLGAAAVQTYREQPLLQESALKAASSRRQDQISSIIARLVDESAHPDEAAVLRALTIGDRDYLSPQVRSSFRKSGATHLLALSGLHVGIIYKIISLALLILGNCPVARRLRALLTLAFLWWFAIVSGLSPSICRAVLMITLYETGTLLGRRGDGINALALSALIITLFNPEAPRELSFQMSFCACLSIFTVFPRMKALLHSKSRLITGIWECAALAISCQMTSGLIGFYHFGTFPKNFLITNILTVPLVAAILYLCAIALSVYPVPHSAACVNAILLRVLQLLNFITSTIASI